MSRSPGATSFQDSCTCHHDLNKYTFDFNDYCKEQVDYLAEHPEVTTLAAVFVSRMVKKKAWCCNTLKEAGIFFTRSIDILDDEIKQEWKRTEKYDDMIPRQKEENETIKTDSFRSKQEDSLHEYKSGLELTPKASMESLYSGFVTESTSASTMPVLEVPEPPKPSLTEIMHQLVLKILNRSLNYIYATRDRELVYDEAYLCLMRVIQGIVEKKWNPIIDDVKELLETMLDDVRSTALQRHRIKLRAIDKVPIKAERLRNNYRGFSSRENQPPTREEILDTMKERKWSYNRYPKDAFGVYISSEKENDSSVNSELSEYKSLCSIAASQRSYASTCLQTMPCQPFIPHLALIRSTSSKGHLIVP